MASTAALSSFSRLEMPFCGKSSISSAAKYYFLAFAIVTVLYRLLMQGAPFTLQGYGLADTRSNATASTDTAGPQFNIVVAHFRENPNAMRKYLDQIRKIPNLARLGTETTIYTKSRIKLRQDNFKNITAADSLFRLRDIGRESGTYLHHIIQNYDNLPQYTMFLHDNPVGRVEETGLFAESYYDVLRYALKNTTGFLNHGPMEPGTGWCYCGDCPGPNGGSFPLMPQIMAIVNSDACYNTEQGQRVALGGQFVVHRDRITAHPKWVYEYLFDLVMAPHTHWIHGQKEPREILEWMGGASKPENPLFAATMERLWSQLFGCADPYQEGCAMFLDRGGPVELPEEFQEDFEQAEDVGNLMVEP